MNQLRSPAVTPATDHLLTQPERVELWTEWNRLSVKSWHRKHQDLRPAMGDRLDTIQLVLNADWQSRGGALLNALESR